MGRVILMVGALLLMLVLVNSTVAPFFVVDERERAIKLLLGEIDETEYQPGLHFKWPFVNTIYKFDGRILTLDAPPEAVLTSEKKNVMVDSFVKWRIVNTAEYFKSTGGDQRRARSLLAPIVKKEVLDAFGKRTMQDVIAGEREAVMQEIAEATNRQTAALGVEVIDVRVKKVELPDDVSDSVYRRMEKERATVAKAFRSRGEEAAKGITADADRQVAEILSEAYKTSQEIRGEGDASAAEVYAQAYGKDPEFYGMYRSLNAYKSTFSGKNDVLLIKPDSQFFKYFNGVEQ
jgi:membrane protease subunit HflC